jgi:hypothetical protein
MAPPGSLVGSGCSASSSSSYVPFPPFRPWFLNLSAHSALAAALVSDGTFRTPPHPTSSRQPSAAQRTNPPGRHQASRPPPQVHRPVCAFSLLSPLLDVWQSLELRRFRFPRICTRCMNTRDVCTSFIRSCSPSLQVCFTFRPPNSFRGPIRSRAVLTSRRNSRSPSHPTRRLHPYVYSCFITNSFPYSLIHSNL